ncbi:4-aminobutyrate--pyruvate transaminase [Saccharomonospora amisosensis]|uniref:4-aminobutyrate--pyruvate transaminase n=1 Tax=Saccharomonospora amisosensis TaxID=1128677 RepID=A0A7X5UU83_9PSEU|nr:aminotransferase class III-fold pyridoxal phosphate-dependent enzyme [Saccharomonospora amisosensis]NIJ14283.1 4-aminobutyrate--pyruvate transaminase [Saccharomonospora amisosensis]
MGAEPTILEPHTPHQPSEPHIIVRGEGCRVWDSTGAELLDAVAGLWCVSLGYSERRLIDAATRQLERLPFYGSFNHRTNDVALALADELAAVAPMSRCKVFFANSGSEANDSAIKFAWYYHAARGEADRTVILSHERAYHGSTAVAASATGLAHMHGGFGPLPFDMFHRLPCPDPAGELARESSPEEFEDRLLAVAEETIQRLGPKRIAAVIAEPVLGAGGLVVPPPGYLRRLKELLRQHGILLIADEVITAFGRTGSMFGSQHFSVEPDLLTVAKGLSSAYLPISAVLLGEHVWRALGDQSSRLGTLGHGFTYSGHPVCAAVARESLRIVVERDLPGRVRQVTGPVLGEAVSRLADAPGVLGVRSLGLLAGIDLAAATKPGVAGKRLAARAVEQGVIVRAIGDTLILAPPLATEEHDLTDMVKRLDAALAAEHSAPAGE